MRNFTKAALAAGICLLAFAGPASADQMSMSCTFGCQPGFNSPEENLILQNRAVINDESKHGHFNPTTNISIGTQNVNETVNGNVTSANSTTVANANSTSVDAKGGSSVTISNSQSNSHSSQDADSGVKAGQVITTLH